MQSESVTFISEGYNLNGVLTHSSTSTKIGGVVLHPHPLYGGDMENHVVRSLETVLLREGISTLRFNFRGASTTPQGFSGIRGAITDAVSAIDFMKSQPGIADVCIAGYSFGASTAIRLALLKPPPFLVSLSASMSLISEDGFSVGTLSNIKCPVLMFHGTADRMIPFSDLMDLANALEREYTSMVSLEGENHFYQRTLSRVETKIQDFIRALPSR